jgi:hypothetical protein
VALCAIAGDVLQRELLVLIEDIYEIASLSRPYATSLMNIPTIYLFNGCIRRSFIAMLAKFGRQILPLMGQTSTNTAFSLPLVLCCLASTSPVMRRSHGPLAALLGLVSLVLLLESCIAAPCHQLGAWQQLKGCYSFSPSP